MVVRITRRNYMWQLLFDPFLYFTPIYSVVLHTILTEQDARSLHARLFTPVTAVGVGQVACCSRGKRMICIARWRRICALYRKRALSASNEDEDQSVTVFVGRSYPPEKNGDSCSMWTPRVRKAERAVLHRIYFVNTVGYNSLIFI